MSKIQFQAKVNLRRATQLQENDWEIEITLSDAEGLVRGQDIREGDVLVFNTSIVETGTYTRYNVKEIKEVSWTGEITLVVEYRDDNTNDSPNPELDFLEGEDGIITRPSAILGLLPVVSPSQQNINDAYSFYTLNHNLVKILDHPRTDGGGGSGGTVNGKLITAQWLPVFPDGRAPLPIPPLGDVVLNMGLAFLIDGSMIEILGVEVEQDSETGDWFAVIPPADAAEFENQIGALTVSYLVDYQ